MAGVRDNTVTNVVSGGIASFKSVGQVPLKSLKVNFNPIQEGDGDPSPSNIRPISGWTGLNVNQSGKNLYDITSYPFSYGWIHAGDGTYDTDNYLKCTKSYIPCYHLAGQIITLNHRPNGTNPGIAFYDINKARISGVKNNTAQEGTSMTANVPSNAYYMRFTITEPYENEIQIESGSTSTAYEPYNGTTVPVSWSDLGTVYGGYVDLISGEIWKTFWQYTFTGEETFNTNSSNSWVITYIQPVDGYYPTAATPYEGICSHYPYGPYSAGKIGVMYNERTCTFDYRIHDAAGWKQYCTEQYIAGTPVQVAYKLKTPQLVGTIDPITIKSLIGVNNIWSNADSVEAQYCALESLQIYKQRFKTNQPHLQSSSGNMVSFQTDMVAPLKECKVYFQPIQASGTPSPDNVLPISGWNNLDIWHIDEVMPMNYIVGETTNYGVTWTVKQDGTVHAEGTPTSYAGCSYANIDVNGDEILYGVIKGNLNNVAFNKPTLYDENWNVISISGSDNILQDGLDLSQYTGVKTVRVNIKRSRNDVYMQGDTRVIVQKNNPPSINTASITLPSTYYGGWVDLTSGEIWATYEYTNLGEKNWTADDQTTQPGCFRAGNSYFGNENGIKYMGKGCSSHYNVVQKSSWTSVSYGEISVTNSIANPIVRIRDERFIDKTGDEVKALLSGVYYAYERAVPRFIGTLTPEQLKTLKNQNNIWSNTNGITQVRYWTHGSIADKRKVVWNNLAPPLTSDYWQDRNSTETTTIFEDGIATTQFILLSGSYHTMCTKTSVYTYQGHKYYSRLDCMLNKNIDYIGGDVANIAWSRPFTTNLNEWGTYSYIVTGEQNRNSTTYYPRMTRSGGLQEGTIAKTKNPLVIDLTLMFGVGNEPSTTEEFEALCARNGIDLTQPQPYDEGTQMYWYF